MKKMIVVIGILVAITGCTFPVIPTSVIPTAIFSPTAFPVGSPTPFPSPSASPTPLIVLPTVQSATATPTPTAIVLPSLTPVSITPYFTVHIDSNCRSGPSTSYPRISAILNGETVQILGVTTPDRPVWWYVQAKNTKCWVSGILGTTSGVTTLVPVIVAPPLPTPTIVKNTVEILFENKLDEPICRMEFYVGIDLIARFSWDKGEWKGGGSDQFLDLPVGKYDLIEIRNCKGELIKSLYNIVLNQDNDVYSLKP